MSVPHQSSTLTLPSPGDVPRHVAIILDGNGRWAQRRRLPRFAGHKRGVEAVRRVVRACTERGVGYLTLFAFSSENWRRPAEEVALLMQIFVAALTREVRKLHRNDIRLKVIGDTSRFDREIRSLIEAGERLTEHNRGLTLTVAANYGGRWDVLQALTRLVREHPEAIAAGVREEQLAPYLSMAYAPEPDLFIRPGGEQRRRGQDANGKQALRRCRPPKAIARAPCASPRRAARSCGRTAVPARGTRQRPLPARRRRSQARASR